DVCSSDLPCCVAVVHAISPDIAEIGLACPADDDLRIGLRIGGNRTLECGAPYLEITRRRQVVIDAHEIACIDSHRAGFRRAMRGAWSNRRGFGFDHL